MESVIDTINRMMSEKENKKISPLVLSFTELQRERTRLLKEELNALCEDSNIKPVKLLNDMGITL